MLVTEEQAKEMWCPFVRFKSHIEGSGTNRDNGNSCPRTSRCIAADCMAWRWGADENGDPAYQTSSIPNAPGHMAHAPLGYCGLAGKP